MSWPGLGETGIANLVRRFVDESDLHRIPANMANPERLARRILFALSRLPQQFPDAGFPKVMAPGAISLLPLADDCKPARLKQEVGAWKPRPLRSATWHRLRQADQAANRSRIPTEILEGVRAIGHAGRDGHERVRRYRPVHHTESNREMVASSPVPLRRIDYCANPGGRVSYCGRSPWGRPPKRSRPAGQLVGNNFHSQELPVEQIDDLRDAVGRNEDEMDVMTIWDIPSAIERRANAPRLTPADRESRITSAAAMEILLAISALSPEALSAINLATDVTRLGEWDPHIQGRQRTGTHREARRYGPSDGSWSWSTSGRRTRRSSPWLFASKNRSKPQKRRIAMNALATNIQMTAGRRFQCRGHTGLDRCECHRRAAGGRQDHQ